jgi:integrase
MSRWFLWRRANGRYYACRHDPRRRQVERHALGTRDPEQAELAFHRFVLEHAELRNVEPGALTVAMVVERYWLQHGQHLAGADVQRRALRFSVEGLGDLSLAELTPHRQQLFVEQLRARGQSDPYIKRTLGALRAALWRAYRRGEVTSVPYIITGDLADSRPRERVLEIAELAAFWRAVDSEALARWVMLLLGTGARPGALVELTAGQIDVLRRRIDLHPPGAPETGKRNPILPIVPSLLPWVETPRAPFVIERRLKALRAGWVAARARAGLGTDVLPYSMRHTLATWMSEQNVPEPEITAWFGHGRESTTRHWYIKRRVYRPDYLAEAAAAVEKLLVVVKRDAGEVATSPASVPVQLGRARVSSVAMTKPTGSRSA